MASQNASSERDERYYGLVLRLEEIDREINGTQRLDKRRLLKAKKRHLGIFLETIRSREENVLKSLHLIDRHKRVLRRKKPGLFFKLSRSLYRLFRPIIRLLSKFASIISIPSPPPSSFARNWSFTEEELYLWSKDFSMNLLNNVKSNALLLRSKAKTDLHKMKLKIRKGRLGWKEKSKGILSKASESLKRGKETAFKYVK
ncbi:MAG: hypothetical protein NDF54_00080 [archaeon GB-1867-035]|nr:hypothetical protein [Candidatus Culexmicrobium profundum]